MSEEKTKLSLPVNFWVANLRKDPLNPLLGDVFLRVENHEDAPFKAHRLVLAGASPVLARKFENWTPEEEKLAEVTFSPDEVTHRSLGEVIDILYDREVDLSFENVFDLHSASNFLSIENLAEKCLDYMKRHMSINNVDIVLSYSKGVFPSSVNLAKTCIKFLAAKFSEISVRTAFLELDWAEIEAISAERICITFTDSDEGLVLELLDFLLRWMNHKWDLRYEHAAQLAKLIDWERVDLTAVEELESWKVLLEGRESKSDAEKLAEYFIVNNLLRGRILRLVKANDEENGLEIAARTETDIYCIRMMKNGHGYMCRCYDTTNGQWTNETRLAYPYHDRDYHIISALKFLSRPCVLLNSGGLMQLHVFEHRRILKPFATLLRHPTLPSGEPLLIYHGTHGWVCCLRLNPDGSPSRLFVYDLSNCWISRDGTSTPGSGPHFKADVVVYDVTGRLGGRRLVDFSIAIVENYIVLFGGYDRNAQAYHAGTLLLDLKSKKWTSGPPVPHIVYLNPGLTVVGQYLFVTGGSSGPGVITSAWRLDTRKREWISLPSMLRPRRGHILLHAGGRLFALGGTTENAPHPADSSFQQDDWAESLPLLADQNAPWVLSDDFFRVLPQFAVSI